MSRLQPPCADCAGGQCPEHAADGQLITDYRHHRRQIMRHALAEADPADVQAIIGHEDETPPTVLACSLLIARRLRQLAADGPFTTRIDGALVSFTVEDGVLIEQPLADAEE